MAEILLDRFDLDESIPWASNIAKFVAELKDDLYLAQLAREMKEFKNGRWDPCDQEHQKRMIDHFIDCARSTE